MKYEHEVIRDLMPLCMDGIASPQSQKAVEEHISECPDCAKEWDIMKNEIQVYESKSLPDDTPKFAETAKRVRKHNRWMLLRITCCFVVILFAALLIVNFKDGARLTARGAAKQGIQAKWSDLFASPEEEKAAGAPVITYLGETQSPDKCAAHVYVLVESADSSINSLGSMYADRGDEVLRLGLWMCGGAGFGQPIAPNAVYLLDPAGTYQNGGKTFASVAVYATDERVASVELTVDGNPVSMTLDKNGFCAVQRENYSMADSLAGKDTDIREGKAMDASGKVLYTLEPIVSEYGWTYYDWVSTE